MTSSLSARKARWIDLYDGRRREVLLVHYWGEPSPLPRPLPFPGRVEERVAWSLAAYRRQVELMEWLDDDALPFLDPYTGTEIFARAFGCPAHLPENHMPFALPRVRGAREARGLKPPSLEHPALAEVIEIADRLRAAEPGALMRLPDIQSPFGIAALVWEKADFLAAMILEPAAVKELAAMAEALLSDFLDLWFARYGHECVAHHPAYYVPRGVTMSDDEAGAINAGMYAEFVLPGINRLSERHGRWLGIHCCAQARHQWPHFKALTGLSVLNLSQDSQAIMDAEAFFGDACAHMHHPSGDGFVPRPGARRIREAHAGSREDAIRLCRERDPA